MSNRNAFSIIVPSETVTRAGAYLLALQSGRTTAGRYLRRQLEGVDLRSLSELELLGHLVETKQPHIFAESAIIGDGSDWNLAELGLLGDISIGAKVTVFDNGSHSAPCVHCPPFHGTLVFTPGALLRNDRGFTPADWSEVTTSTGKFSFDGYYALYQRRLAAVLRWINSDASASSPAFITIPGLGCGQFAGVFRGSLGAQLSLVLRKLLEKLAEGLTNISVVYFDPYRECSNDRAEVYGIRYLVRPLMEAGNHARSQLSHPSSFAEAGDDFSACYLYSIVARDHVSWPGNDFYAGVRATDDGVKAAATDSMYAMTGVEGLYDPQRFMYLPPAPHENWAEVVDRRNRDCGDQKTFQSRRVRLSELMRILRHSRRSPNSRPGDMNSKSRGDLA